MSLQENMAASIRAIMKNRHKSLSEFSAELGISRNALYNYLRGRGNPSIATLEHMAKNLGVSPAALMLGVFDTDRRQVMLTLLGTIGGMADLPEDKRLRIAVLRLELVKLWTED